MKKIWVGLVVWGTFCVCGFSDSLISRSFAQNIHPTYLELKPFRTYYVIERVTPIEEQFDIYVEFPRSAQFQFEQFEMGVSSAEQIRGSTLKKLKRPSLIPHMIPQSVIRPDQVFTSTPDHLKELSQAIREKIDAQYPNAKGIRVRYQGRYGTVSIREIIPVSHPEATHHHVSNVLRTYHYNEDLNQLEPARDQDFRGITTLDQVASGRSPRFLSFQLPQELQGSSLFDTLNEYAKASRPVPAALQEHWTNFQSDVLKSIPQILAKKYKNPIFTLIKNQGSELEKLRPTLLQATFYIKTFDLPGYDYLTYSRTVELPLVDAMDRLENGVRYLGSTVRVTTSMQSEPNTEFDLTAELIVGHNSYIKVTASDPKGIISSVSGQFKIDAHFFNDGPVIRVAHRGISIAPKDATQVVQLKGIGKHDRFQILLNKIEPIYKIRDLNCGDRLDPN